MCAMNFMCCFLANTPIQVVLAICRMSSSLNFQAQFWLTHTWFLFLMYLSILWNYHHLGGGLEPMPDFPGLWKIQKVTCINMLCSTPFSKTNLYPLPLTNINPNLLSVDCCWVREGAGVQLPRYWHWFKTFIQKLSKPTTKWKWSLLMVVNLQLDAWRSESYFILETLAAKVESSAGVYFVPAFSGLYAPYWQTDARGWVNKNKHYRFSTFVDFFCTK